ncbi:hypothetical protein P9429_11735 [Bacillus atrophaeus]|uniref:hypothetical protein n=1 Tax=Bacillus atrophaeus TaxID=1452 RepID=UPI002E1CD75E|nr:hypothetical protein [Bacillus atrophaeus]
MGVEIYACDCCGDSKYEEYVDHCGSCGHRLGTCCVVNDDVDSSYAFDYGVRYDGSEEQIEEYGIDLGDYEIDDIIEYSGIAPKYCPFCSGEVVVKEYLFDYLLKKYGLIFEEVKAEYLAQKKEMNANESEN